MQQRELKDISVSSLALAVAFAIAMSDGIGVLLQPSRFAYMIGVSLLAVSLGFVMHELGHRFVAKRFGCYAEFRMWRTGIIIALFFSIFGFVFAAPGAVVIHQRMDLWGRRKALSRKSYAMISLSGPMMNIILASAFLILNITYPSQIFVFAKQINLWLALFNLIPFPPLDGIKIFSWNKLVWLATGAAAIILFML